MVILHRCVHFWCSVGVWYLTSPNNGSSNTWRAPGQTKYDMETEVKTDKDMAAPTVGDCFVLCCYRKWEKFERITHSIALAGQDYVDATIARYIGYYYMTMMFSLVVKTFVNYHSGNEHFRGLVRKM
jgi:hypothetical protein